MADKVIGGENHLTDITVKARFVPVLTDEKKTCYFTIQAPISNLVDMTSILLIRLGTENGQKFAQTDNIKLMR